MNKDLFASQAAAPADTKNQAGGDAYAMGPEQGLAQLAVTGCFAGTFYVSAQEQLDNVLAFARQCDDEYVAQVALYARHAGFMKDSPAVLMAYLFGKRSPVVREYFPKVIDNVKMLSNFVQAVRSAKFGRRSLGTQGKRLIQNWLNERSVDYLFRQSIAKDPSLGDIIRLSRPKATGERDALYNYLIGRRDKMEDVPDLVKQYERFKEEPGDQLPDLPFNMLDQLPLKTEHWRQLFERGGYQFTRMNLNTAARHGLLGDESMVELIANRLETKENVLSARQFPYQMLMAYNAASNNVDLPNRIKTALHAAMEHATVSVPSYEGAVYVAVDCSGSMASPVTGYRGRSTSSVRYADVAALFAACVLRRTPNARIMTFSDEAVYVPLDPADTIMTVTNKLARAGGGTDCSAPLRKLNREKRHVDLFILISDNESWLDSRPYFYGISRRGSAPGTVGEWAELKKRCPNAKQVRINISPNATDQLPERDDTLRVAGFSDAVFQAISAWAKNQDWVSTVKGFTV